ncbi:transcription factor DUO1-like [Primulina huaijiensis]|uniref:transcription factor DUO1-like n=1 Tax=Primulina huaijiensis TaxID=1492673 RepID=UPI003CC77827
MEGKSRMIYDEMEEIQKGPWKEEEDRVLLNHVKKYGPRDWSSIRSKGLLQRTGKSCRLRWVNKLRPDLKNGVKFSAEEERTVIDLQAQFGNKWARIATYLAGRTDNDVKNFWSSRQKRLARILQTSAPSSSRSHKSSIKEFQAHVFHDVSSVEAPKFSSSTEEESVTKSQSFSSSRIHDTEKAIKMEPLPDITYPSSLYYDSSLFQLYYDLEKKPFLEPQLHLPFFQIPQFQPDLSVPVESQEFVSRFGDPTFLDVFGHASGSMLGTAKLPIVPSSFALTSGSQVSGSAKIMPDTFVEDFPPMDMFDQIEPLPSPSEWS